MYRQGAYWLLSLLFWVSSTASASLEYDAQANKVKLFGPYVKYNFLQKPYSLGRYGIESQDLQLEITTNGEGQMQVHAKWPRFLLELGELRVSNLQGRQLTKQSFSLEDLGEDQKFARLLLDESSEGFVEVLKEGFQFCVEQQYNLTQIIVCSPTYDHKGSGWRARADETFQVSFDGKTFPKNAQIDIPKGQKQLHLVIRAKSGFLYELKDEVRHLQQENLLIDPKEKRIGVMDGSGKVTPTRLGVSGQVVSFMKEKNYFIDQYKASQNWAEPLTDAEMEFAPYNLGSGMQLYGLILPKSPPPFEFRLNERTPIATYLPVVELRGRKSANEDLRAKEENELLIHQNQMDFIWLFPAGKKGQINQNYLSLRHDKRDYFFSTRIFRAHQTAISGSVALSTSPTLDIVPGYNFTFDHWFEEIWGKASWSYQRLGIKANIYETIQGFKPREDFAEKLSVLPINMDLLYRFSPGVRPVQSSFGLGLRYMQFKLFRSVSDDAEAGLVGVGGFWHTAPQRLVDDIFNVVPFFRYPKWMELSFYYYPLVVNGLPAGFSFSWQARGQMFFAQNWFLDASFNVNNIAFKKEKLEGVTLGADAFGIGTAHGTIGIGYLFN